MAVKKKNNKPIKINYLKFIEENFLILDRETQVPVPFVANDVQKKFYEQLKENSDGTLDGVRNIILKARQQGISSFILALFTVDFLMRPHSVSVCISHRQDSTDFLFKKVKFYLDCYLENLAKTTGQDLDELKKKFFKSNNRNLLENNLNNSSFYILTAGAKVGGRGNSVRNVLFSEAAFYSDTEMVTAQEMIMATAQMVPQGHGMIFMESTANGEGNYYHQTWEKASKHESSYLPIFYGWEEFYTEEWIAEKRKDFNNDKMFMQEYPRCLSADTIVSGDNYLSQIINNKEKISNGSAQTFKLRTEKGYNLLATENHSIYNGFKYKKLKEYKIGEEISLLSPKFNLNKKVVPINLGLNAINSLINIDMDWGLFLGLFMGDGSLSGKDNKYTLSIVCDQQDNDTIKVSSDLIEKLFKKPNQRIVGIKGGGIEIRTSSKYFKGLFSQLGLIYQNSSGSFKRKVHVPDYIIESPKEVIREFLKGLFEADGFVGYKSPRIVLFSKYQEFLEKIQVLLLGFGITSKIKIANKTSSDGHIYIGRELRLNGFEVKKFNEKIGFISDRKNKRFISHTFNSPRTTKIEFKDRVISITKDEVRPVFNLTTKDHYYSANGIWTHNSPDEAFITSGTPFFDVHAIKEMEQHKKPPIMIGRFSTGGYFEASEHEEDAMVKIYRDIEQDEQLVVFADPADGQDFCAAVACSKKHYDVPVVFNAKMESSQFGYDLYYFCTWIHNKTGIWPKLAIERNTGQATIYVLKQLNYPDLFRMVDFTAQESGTYEHGAIGWMTTGYMAAGELKGTRRKMLDDLALSIRQRSIKFYDTEIFDQMKAFKIIKGRAQASRNKHDDLVIAVAGAWQVQELTPDYDFGWDEDAKTREERRSKWRFK